LEEIGRRNEDWKMSAGYARRLRESGSVGAPELMLKGLRVRKRFREILVTKLKERGYHGRKAGGRACLAGGPGCERVRLKGVRRMAEWQHGNGDFRCEGRKRLGAGGRVSGGGGSKASGRKRAASNASRRCVWRPEALEVALSLPDGMNPGGRTQNSSFCYKGLERPAHSVRGERWSAR